jgi:hypothetical protein
MNDVDGELYDNSTTFNPNRRRRPEPDRDNRHHRANEARAQVANQANVATQRQNQHTTKCFHCNSDSHGVNDCPTATEAQKAQCWVKFYAEKDAKRAARENTRATGNFVSNRFKNTAPNNTGTNYDPSKKARKTRFAKSPRSGQANVVTVDQVSIIANTESESSLIHTQQTVIKGIPPVHQSQLGIHPMNYWLIDSGSSAHMTPYTSDLNTNSFKPCVGFVRVANNQQVEIIGTGEVTILIKCYVSGENITWTLYNVLVVPKITRRLISTDALSESGHSVRFEPSGAVVILREHPNATTQRRITMIKVPKEWDFDPQSQQYHWPTLGYGLATRDV